jgi:hypothetical protein
VAPPPAGAGLQAQPRREPVVASRGIRVAPARATRGQSVVLTILAFLPILDLVAQLAGRVLVSSGYGLDWDCSILHNEGRTEMTQKDDKPVCEAANLFKEEILQIMPDIPQAQLVDMVSVYIFYHYGINKEEAKRVIEKTCL